MLFRQLLHDQVSCASYVVGCPSRGVAAVIDAQAEIAPYLELAERHGLAITDVLDTHVHADHRSGARALAAATDARLYLGEGADVGFDHLPLRDGDEIAIGNRKMRVIHTPGHTPEHVSVLVDDWFVMTGDTLFVGDVGRVDLSTDAVDEAELERRARTLHASLRVLRDLDDHVEVYPGHYAGSTCGRGMDGKPMSTIGREKLFNQPFSLAEDSFIAFQLNNVPPLPKDFAEIKRRNIAA